MAIYANFITGGVNNHTTTSEEANSFATDFVGNGIVGTLTNTSGVAPTTGGFAVNAQGSPNMTVAVSAGQAYVTATPSGQSSQKIRVYSTATENVTINANSSGSTKYDWVYIKVDATKASAPNLAGTDVSTLVTSRSTSATTDDGTPPTYGVAIAVVTVANGATSITNGNIRDVRSQSLISATTQNDTGWTTSRNFVTNPTPNTVAYNGNRSYTLTFNSTDLTGYISPGMRVRTTRTVSAPTQSASLNGSTQYFNKTTPNKLSFTDDFVVSAWVKLNAYGSTNVIASRYNGTSGWSFEIDTTGRVKLVGLNSGGANFSQVLSYQSVPLNKWVHISAQLDMSTFTATTTTSYVMIDGLDVPAVVSRGGTNPTSLIQAGNLEIGSQNGGVSPFNGKLAQVAIFNAKVTQATIRSYISQGLSGSETSLASAYSLSNSLLDLNTTTPNDLTAQGSATTTNADSPFSTNSFGTETGTLDYGIVTSCTFSTNTTMVVQTPEGCTIPTSGGVSAFAYSVQKAPYGMPVNTGRWAIESLQRTLISQTTPVQNTWYNLASYQINIPIGAWTAYYKVSWAASDAGLTSGVNQITLSTANNTESDPELSGADYHAFNATGGNSDARIATTTNKKSLTLSAATQYYVNMRTQSAGIDSLDIRGDLALNSLRLECDYL